MTKIVLELACAYVRKPGNEAGGNLHIVLDDLNVEDDFVQFCLYEATSGRDEDGAELAQLLLAMPEADRLAVAERCWG